MGALISWLASALASIAGFAGAGIAKKTVFATAAVAASIALTLALGVVIANLLTGIVATLPAWAVAGAGMFIPDNASACISALITAKTARFVYDWNMTNLKLVAMS